MMPPIVTTLGLAAVIAAAQPLGAQPASPPSTQAPAAKPTAEDAKAEAGKAADAAKADTSKMALKDDFVVTTRRQSHHRRPGNELHRHGRHHRCCDEDGKPKASIFFIAYTRDGVADAARRARHVLASTAAPARRRCGCTWARSGRGASRWTTRASRCRRRRDSWTTSRRSSTSPTSCSSTRSAPATAGRPPARRPKQFHGVQEDIESVGEFIRLYTTRNGAGRRPSSWPARATAPRAPPASPDHLQDRHGMYLNGVVLISSILNFQTARFDDGNDLPYSSSCRPTRPPPGTTRSWPGAAGRPAEDAGARRSASPCGEYTLALMQGQRADRRRAARQSRAKLARLTGLSAEYVERTNLRVEIHALHQGAAARPSAARSAGSTAASRASTATPPASEPEFDPSYAADPGAVHGGAQRLRAPRAEVRERPALRDPDRPGAAVELRRLPEPLPERGADAAPGDDAEPAPEGVRRQRLLRPGDAVLRHRVHVQPPGLSTGAAATG